MFVVNCCLLDKISEAILYRARVSRRFGSENTKRGTTAKEEEDKEREKKRIDGSGGGGDGSDSGGD